MTFLPNHPEPAKKAVVLTLLPLLGVLAAAMITLLLPKYYFSNVVMTVESDSQLGRSRMEVVVSGLGGLKEQTDFLKSDEILDPVIEATGLAKRWNIADRDEILSRLRAAINTKKVSHVKAHNRNGLQLGVWDAHPEEAALLANAIADEFRRNRVAEKERLEAIVLHRMRDEVLRQRNNVAQCENRLVKARQQLSTGIEDDAVLDANYVEARTEYIEARKVLKAAESDLLTAGID